MARLLLQASPMADEAGLVGGMYAARAKGCRNFGWRMEDRTWWYGSPVAIIYLVLLVTLGIISIRKGHDRWLIRRPWIVG